MNEVLNEIRNAVGKENLCQSLSRDGCVVDSGSLPHSRIVVDIDQACPDREVVGSRCDFVVFFAHDSPHRVVAVPLELKSGSAIAAHVSAQLQQGADFADRVAPPETGCLPVLMRRGKINLHKLNREKIEYRGLQLTIRVGRCNKLNNLSDVLFSGIAL